MGKIADEARRGESCYSGKRKGQRVSDCFYACSFECTPLPREREEVWLEDGVGRGGRGTRHLVRETERAAVWAAHLVAVNVRSRLALGQRHRSQFEMTKVSVAVRLVLPHSLKTHTYLSSLP